MSKGELDRRKKIERLEAKCHERGLPVTVQRRVIFDALLDRQDHPTIDQVYDDVKSRIPGVSRTTVYRTLETLAELGVAKKASHFAAMARFDGNMEHHHHLVCVRCDKVVDFADPALVGFLYQMRAERVSRSSISRFTSKAYARNAKSEVLNLSGRRDGRGNNRTIQSSGI